MAAVSAEGRTVWVLIRRLNSSCSRSIALVVRALFHWLSGNRVKVKSRSPLVRSGARSHWLRSASSFGASCPRFLAGDCTAPIPDLPTPPRNRDVRLVADILNLGPMRRLVFDGAVLSD